jgi:hypothetical protein
VQGAVDRVLGAFEENLVELNRHHRVCRRLHVPYRALWDEARFTPSQQSFIESSWVARDLAVQYYRDLITDVEARTDAAIRSSLDDERRKVYDRLLWSEIEYEGR